MSTELVAFDASRVIDSYGKDIKMSPAKAIVFRDYLDRLTTTSTKIPSIYKFEPGKYHIYTCGVIPGITNSRKWNWSKMKEYVTSDIGCLKTVTFLTFDMDTMEEETTSFESIYDIPLSACLFSNKMQDKFNSYVKDDYNFVTANYSPIRLKTERGNPIDVIKKDHPDFDPAYWDANYTFNEHYDREEYLLHTMQETKMIGSMTEMTSAPNDYTVKNLTSKTAAIIIAYHMDQADDIVPVTYTELHTSFGNVGTIRIEWSRNGIITVK